MEEPQNKYTAQKKRIVCGEIVVFDTNLESRKKEYAAQKKRLLRGEIDLRGCVGTL